MALYQKGSVFDLERALEERLQRQVAKLEFQSSELESIVDALRKEYSCDPPQVDLPDELEPTRQSERMVHDDGRFARIPFPQQYKVLDVVYEISVRGTADLLDWSPQSLAFTFSSDPPIRNGNKVRLEYTVPLDAAGPEIAHRIKDDIDLLKRNVSALAQWAVSWNESLERRVRSAVARRASELQQRNSVSESLRIRL